MSSRLARLNAVWRALRQVPLLLWQTDARLSSQLFALQLSQALVPVAQLWVAKLIVDLPA